MQSIQKKQVTVSKELTASGAAAVSALAFWFGMGLNPHWWLIWLAPLPVLLVAPRLRYWPAWITAFVALAVGSLNIWKYLHSYIGLPLRICVLAVVGPALVFAMAVMLFRRFMLRGRPISAALIFPATWVAFEFLSEHWSINGTWGSLAYTQPDFLPILQVAAITGVWGISFAILFFPAAVAAIAQAKRRLPLAVIAIVAYAIVLGWGVWRLHAPISGEWVKVGLISSDEPHSLFPHDDPKGLEVVRKYASAIDHLVQQGAQVVVVPEKIASMSTGAVAEADAVFGEAARRDQVFVMYGVDHRIGDKTFNQSRMFTPAGDLLASYDKHHLVPYLEDVDTPGNARASKDLQFGRIGLTICKDMDFPKLSREYGGSGAALMLVPAWDFDIDRWLHSRMAIVRGVESGFSMARSAKQGILSVSDNRGRVLAERATGQLPFSELLASVPVSHTDTLYVRWGDWFGWFNLALFSALLMTLLVGRNTIYSARA
jgi:apolipoprotein N-acyltransferase